MPEKFEPYTVEITSDGRSWRKQKVEKLEAAIAQANSAVGSGAIHAIVRDRFDTVVHTVKDAHKIHKHDSGGRRYS
jgi:hypothetical protein